MIVSDSEEDKLLVNEANRVGVIDPYLGYFRYCTCEFDTMFLRSLPFTSSCTVVNIFIRQIFAQMQILLKSTKYTMFPACLN